MFVHHLHTYICIYESMYACMYVHMPNSNSKSKPVEPVAKAQHNLYLGAETETEIHILLKHRGSLANVTFGLFFGFFFLAKIATHNAYAKTYVHTYIFDVHTYL